jgi:hypothetical protein
MAAGNNRKLLDLRRTAIGVDRPGGKKSEAAG